MTIVIDIVSASYRILSALSLFFIVGVGAWTIIRMLRGEK